MTDHDLMKRLDRGVVTILVTVASAAFAFGLWVANLQASVRAHEGELLRIDHYGTQGVQVLARQIDSLRFEMRQMRNEFTEIRHLVSRRVVYRPPVPPIRPIP